MGKARASHTKVGFKPFEQDIFDSEPLTDPEREHLGRLEGDIENNIAGFMAAGTRLAEIANERLWRESYKTFKQYCEIRWGFTPGRATQLMAAARVAESITNCKLELPAPGKLKLNEGIAREYVKLHNERPSLVPILFDEVTKQQARATAKEHRLACSAVEGLPDTAKPAEIKRAVRDALKAKREPRKSSREREILRDAHALIGAFERLAEVPLHLQSDLAKALQGLSQDDRLRLDKLVTIAADWIATYRATIADEAAR